MNNRFRVLMYTFLGCMAANTVVAEDIGAAMEGFRKEIQVCKTSADQTIDVELVKSPGKPVTEAASAEELTRVKSVLEKSNMPYDLVNHRATYEFTLALIRVKNVAVFKVTSPNKSTDLTAVKNCLAELSSSGGLEYRFE